MKITWFAAMTFRIQIAGRIVVIDPDTAPQAIDAGELVSGADTVIAATTDLAAFDPAIWRPRRRVRLIDDAGEEGLRLYRLGASGVCLDSIDEGMLALDPAESGLDWGRWADNCVTVLCGTGSQCAAHGTTLLTVARPKLIALAVSDGDIDTAFDTLVPQLADASLVVLEAGMAIEV